MPSHLSGRRSNLGLSLIEILVALAIAALLLLGLSQIFIGSKQAYSVQTAVSRSQENARFILGFLESNVRMAGYFGCGSESSIGNNFYNHLVGSAGPIPFNQRFQRPIQGFRSTVCQAGSCTLGDPAPGASANWTPTIPTDGFPAAPAPAPIIGSDILILRVLSAQSAPTMGLFNPSATPDAANPTFKVPNVPGDTAFITAGNVYAIANCSPRVDIFKASAGSTGNIVLAASADNPLLNPTNPADPSTWAWTQAEGDYRQPPNGQLPGTVNGEVYKAQYMAIYVGINPNGAPALYVQQPGAIGTQEIADGVESMQIQYGVDNVGNDGVADEFVGADGVVNPPTADQNLIDAAWRKVVSVHIGLLMRASDRAGVPATASGNQYSVSGVTVTATPDGRFRDVYETTIALRNRLSNF